METIWPDRLQDCLLAVFLLFRRVHGPQSAGKAGAFIAACCQAEQDSHTMTTWLNQIRVSYGGPNEVGKAAAPANSVRLSGNPGRDGNTVGAAQ